MAKKAAKKPSKGKAAKPAKKAAPKKPFVPPTITKEPAAGESPGEPLNIEGANKYNIKIVNMVASANFNVELDLFALAREVDSIEYEPEQFPGAILKLPKPRASLLLFKNGKVICTGARSEKDVERALLQTTEIISKFVT
jgi:hypothetical protein